MPRAQRTLPNSRGFYFSESEYKESALFRIEKVTLYTRNDAGVWFANGERVQEKAVPTDLWPVRMVQA